MNIIVKKHSLLYKGYKLKCSTGKSGLTKLKKEGDLKTPKGLFALGTLYYRNDRIKKIKCKLKKKIIKKKMGWCDDSKSKKYNKEVIYPNKYRTEMLHIKNNIYDMLINIKYNQNPTVKEKGSAIFLHLTDARYKPTKGCVSIQKNDFLKILPHINCKTKILIL